MTYTLKINAEAFPFGEGAFVLYEAKEPQKLIVFDFLFQKVL